MSEMQNCLWRIRVLHFALVETNLFLDKHPDDAAAIAFFNQTKAKYDAAVKEYEQKYGPLSACNVTYSDRFTWVDGPWPWEYGASESALNMGVVG